MPYTPVPDLVDGEFLTDDWTLPVSAAIGELQTAAALIRRRDSRAGDVHPVGSHALDPTTNLENVGGITEAGLGVYTLPETATYAITVYINPTAALGTQSTVTFEVTIAGSQTLVTAALPNTSNAAAASFTARLAAGTTVTTFFVNGTAGNLTIDFEIQITRVSPPPAP